MKKLEFRCGIPAEGQLPRNLISVEHFVEAFQRFGIRAKIAVNLKLWKLVIHVHPEVEHLLSIYVEAHRVIGMEVSIEGDLCPWECLVDRVQFEEMKP